MADWRSRLRHHPLDELVMRAAPDMDGWFDCRCGATVAWVGSPPLRSDLLCDECVDDLAEVLEVPEADFEAFSEAVARRVDEP